MVIITQTIIQILINLHSAVSNPYHMDQTYEWQSESV